MQIFSLYALLQLTYANRFLSSNEPGGSGNRRIGTSPVRHCPAALPPRADSIRPYREGTFYFTLCYFEFSSVLIYRGHCAIYSTLSSPTEFIIFSKNFLLASIILRDIFHPQYAFQHTSKEVKSSPSSYNVENAVLKNSLSKSPTFPDFRPASFSDKV